MDYSITATAAVPVVNAVTVIVALVAYFLLPHLHLSVTDCQISPVDVPVTITNDAIHAGNKEGLLRREPFREVSVSDSGAYRNHLDPAGKRPVYLNDGRCNSSNAEARVLVAISGHSPTPPVEGTHYRPQKASSSHYCNHQESETSLTYPACHPRTRGVPQGDSGSDEIFHVLLLVYG
ncbi:hypothetical protein AVEN_16788-1 [Araneus ventricosus]|uniref:Uncharacterized protein n=1 Tax=Araneus ventricosus TaxID=182803 RepID=A0A4Y2BPW0_ARAVE|nr:hypothetical protein AVEN_16788-1 [Araneus ventricosus]